MLNLGWNNVLYNVPVPHFHLQIDLNKWSGWTNRNGKQKCLTKGFWASVCLSELCF